MGKGYLEGEKTFLTPAEDDDVLVIQSIQNERFVRKFMSSCVPKTITDVQDDLKNAKKSGSPYFIIFQKATSKSDDDVAIGYIKLEIVSSLIRASEVHIGIMEEYTGKGYGKEVIRMITEYAFNELNIHSIRALIRESNTASMKTFESIGYKRVGTLPEWSFYDGGYHDCHIYDCIPRFIK